MATFQYSACASDGTRQSGTLDAPDRTSAFHMLDAKQLQPLSLSEVSSASPKNEVQMPAPARKRETPIRGVRLKSSQVLEFTEELSELLKGGIQLEPALGILERRTELSGLKDLGGIVRAKIRDGLPLAQALKEASPDFGDLYCNLVAAGEVSGSLGEILERQAAHLRAMQELKGRVLFALIYPSFLIASSIAVAILFLVFLIPKLTELLDSTGGTLPLGAQLIVNSADFLKGNWPFLLLIVFLFSGAAIWFSRNRRLAWDQFKLRWPMMGRVFRERFHVQFLETLANLIRNGLPLNQALELTRAATANRYLQTKLDAVSTLVTDGTALSTALQKCGEFPSLMIDMIHVGEQTGDLGGSLQRTAERFDRELNRRVDKLSAVIQPAVVVLMAAMVGAMAYLMISAIFQTIAGLGAG
ncbi:MAG: type II secretion system F family protein [Verrucomicrobiales bacterium]|nr:type II secretion system F family protein [Verrucomicrobiales bacterium]